MEKRKKICIVAMLAYVGLLGGLKLEGNKVLAQDYTHAIENIEAVNKGYKQAQDKIGKETEKVVKKVKEEEERRKADDGIWHVGYSYCYGAGGAPGDGSVGEWAQGWFIAHRGMWGGEKIASCPPLVEVDGRVYQFAYSYVEDDWIYEEEVAKARADGGITFQTCITDSTNLMVHYVPCGSPYPYSWENYPYVTTDGPYIGYYREDYQ